MGGRLSSPSTTAGGWLRLAGFRLLGEQTPRASVTRVRDRKAAKTAKEFGRAVSVPERRVEYLVGGF